MRKSGAQPWGSHWKPLLRPGLFLRALHPSTLVEMLLSLPQTGLPTRPQLGHDQVAGVGAPGGGGPLGTTQGAAAVGCPDAGWNSTTPLAPTLTGSCPPKMWRAEAGAPRSTLTPKGPGKGDVCLGRAPGRSEPRRRRGGEGRAGETRARPRVGLSLGFGGTGADHCCRTKAKRGYANLPSFSAEGVSSG